MTDTNVAANMPNIEDLKANLSTAIRTQIEAELQTDLQKVDDMQKGREKLQKEIAALTDKIDNLKASRNEKSAQLHEANSFLAKFSPEGIDKLVADRLDMMLAAMNGQVTTKKSAAKRSTGTRSRGTNLDGYEVQYAIDGEPRSFGTKTHLTYFLGKKLGRKVDVDELNRVFKEATDIEPFSESHKGQSITASFEGIQVTIGLIKIAE